MNDYYKVTINNLEFYLKNRLTDDGDFRIAAIGYDNVLYLNDYFRCEDFDVNYLKSNYNEIVRLANFILSVVDEELAKQLNEYIEKHINTFDFYNNKVNNFYYLNINKIGKNLPDIISDYYSRIICDEIPKGNIKIKYAHIDSLISYNLISKKLTSQNFSKSSLLETLYKKSELNVILAYNQYVKGLAPEPYKTLAEISKFLDGKKSVRFVMKDKTSYLYKPRYKSFRLLELFEPKTMEDYLTFDFNKDLLFDLFNNKYSLKDLQCFQYSSQRKEIDTSVLLKHYKYSKPILEA